MARRWKSDSYSFSEFVEDITLLAKGWWLVILSVAVSAVILNKAVRDRIQRNEQDELLRQMMKSPRNRRRLDGKVQQTFKPTASDCGKSTNGSDSFKRAFQSQSTPSAPALEPCQNHCVQLQPPFLTIMTLHRNVPQWTKSLLTSSNTVYQNHTSTTSISNLQRHQRAYSTSRKPRPCSNI